VIEEEPERGKEEVAVEAPPKKARLSRKILAIVIAILVAGIAVWYFFFSNAPPKASFTYSSIDLQLTMDATSSIDPDGGIVAYSWDFGDGSVGSGELVTHTYAATGDYTVKLTVMDNRGATGSASEIVAIRFSPVASFVARHDRMTVSFDASGSSPSAVSQSPLVAYEWDFGDGSTGTGITATHTYAQAGRYTVTLTVTDQAGGSGSATRYVSPADTTVDILADQFFTAGCPYDNYWELRYATYGDQILRNETLCTNYYPWVLFTEDAEHNPSYVYTLYRWDARVRNFPGYDLNDPVVLPVLDPSVQPAPDSYIQLNLTMDYLNSTTIDYYLARGYGVDFSDGFGYLVRGTITMDLTMSKRIFGVVADTPAEAQDWWRTHTTPGGPDSGVEAAVAAWLEANGNGKYDVYNAFEWYYALGSTDLNATVAPDGTTQVSVFWSGWGFDVLLARWFYWGKASYRDAVCVRDPSNPLDPCPATRNYGDIQPQGWMPMESCWCERATIQGTIRGSLDLDFRAIQGYHFVAWGNPGPDGILGTSDDKPAWVFEPLLMDYVPRIGLGSLGFPNSELRWYEGLTTVHGSPGSYAYGDPYPYMVPPTRWKLGAGSTLTIILPRIPVPWYDPVQSKWNTTSMVGDYVTFDAPMGLRLITPAGDYYIWDPRAKVLSIAGPHDWGETGLPMTGSPRIEFGPIQ